MRDAPRLRPRLRIATFNQILPALLVTVTLLFAGLLSGCVFGGESERDLSEYFPPPPQEGSEAAEEVTTTGAAPGESQGRANAAYTPPAEDLEDLEVAPPTALFAVQSFFHLVATGDLRSAYERTSTETKERISAEAFEQRYQDVWAEATIGGFTWEVIPQDDPNASSHEVVIHYQTTFFGRSRKSSRRARCVSRIGWSTGRRT